VNYKPEDRRLPANMPLHVKHVALSMDVEDWYHLDYFEREKCDNHYSMLDGLECYAEFLAEQNICSTFFVLGELVKPLKNVLRDLDAKGQEIGVHGWNHIRPIELSVKAFKDDVKQSKETLENALGKPVFGYRAPCFSLDRARLDILLNLGFKYDSSRILFKQHPLYTEINLTGYEPISKQIYRFGDFFEFQVSTHPFLGSDVPVSGGGYIRIFPWQMMRRLIRSYLRENEFYAMYIHPFELSIKRNPQFAQGTGWAGKARFAIGRSSVLRKLHALIRLLKEENYAFTTFSSLREQLLMDTSRS